MRPKSTDVRILGPCRGQRDLAHGGVLLVVVVDHFPAPEGLVMTGFAVNRYAHVDVAAVLLA